MQADVTQLDRWQPESFDLVLDKGCVDAMFDGNMISVAAKGLAEMYRLTRTSGFFVLISLGGPSVRQELLEQTV